MELNCCKCGQSLCPTRTYMIDDQSLCGDCYDAYENEPIAAAQAILSAVLVAGAFLVLAIVLWCLQ